MLTKPSLFHSFQPAWHFINLLSPWVLNKFQYLQASSKPKNVG